MSFRHLLGVAFAASFCASVAAQEVVPPSTPVPDSFPVGPGTGPPPAASPALPAPSGGVVPSPQAPQLMPDQIPSLDKPEAGTAVPPRTTDTPAQKKPDKKTKTEVFEQDLLDRIRFRQVKTVAMADPALVAQWDRSIVAHTDQQKRAALKDYYKQLYARMAKLDGSLKKLIEVRALDTEHHLNQSHFTPTEARDSTERSTSGRVFTD